MTARAILDLTGPFGTFAKGALLHGVPDGIVDVWIADGAAEHIPETATAPAPETPAPPPAETATVAAPEKATSRPRRVKGS